MTVPRSHHSCQRGTPKLVERNRGPSRDRSLRFLLGTDPPGLLVGASGRGRGCSSQHLVSGPHRVLGPEAPGSRSRPLSCLTEVHRSPGRLGGRSLSSAVR